MRVLHFGNPSGLFVAPRWPGGISDEGTFYPPLVGMPIATIPESTRHDPVVHANLFAVIYNMWSCLQKL